MYKIIFTNIDKVDVLAVIVSDLDREYIERNALQKASHNSISMYDEITQGTVIIPGTIFRECICSVTRL